MVPPIGNPGREGDDRSVHRCLSGRSGICSHWVQEGRSPITAAGASTSCDAEPPAAIERFSAFCLFGAPSTSTVAVAPATSSPRALARSSAMRTGTRCASRTQLKVGLTFARRDEPSRRTAGASPACADVGAAGRARRSPKRRPHSRDDRRARRSRTPQRQGACVRCRAQDRRCRRSGHLRRAGPHRQATRPPDPRRLRRRSEAARASRRRSHI